MKKGFTLIELLAVIVILAIIALIAVPIVLNIINDSKESSLLRSAEFYLDAVEYTIADAFLYHGGLDDNTYPITPEGDICKVALVDNKCPMDGDKSNTLVVEVNGDKPTGGTITINGGNISDVSLILDEKTIVKNPDGELVYLKYLDDVCTIVSGTAKTAGAKYECKVDPNKDAYTFYVLTTPNEGDTSINLIMDSNINISGEAVKSDDMDDKGFVAWMAKDDYISEEIGGTESDYGTWGKNNKGPITVLNYLSIATEKWTNTNQQIISTFADEEGETHEMLKTYTVNARLPYYSEISNVSNTTLYLIDYLNGFYDANISIVGRNGVSEVDGYWTLSSYSLSDGGAWFVSFNGSADNLFVSYGDMYGVRPVINLKI